MIRSRRWNRETLQAAALAIAISFSLVAMHCAFAQSQTTPSAGTSYDGAVVTSPYSRSGNQLIQGSPYQPSRSAKPTGWPGGTAETAPQPTGRQRAAAFGASSSTTNAAKASTSRPTSTTQKPPERLANVPNPPAVTTTLSDKTSPAARKAKLPTEFEGTEILARVGGEVILAADLLYDVDKAVAKVLQAYAGKNIPPEQIEMGRRNYLQVYLNKAVMTKLVLIAARRKIPAEAWPKIEKQFYEQFDKQFLKLIIEHEGCKSRTELDARLRKEGTTIEALRRQMFENDVARHWMNENIKDDDEISHEEMLEYYRDHEKEYEKLPRVRWEHLMASFDKFDSQTAAERAIIEWGNQVWNDPKSFADVAKKHSQDISAADGGVHSWTTKGSLVSEELDEAIFALPPGKLSQIIKDPRGYHIVRVIERDEETRTPFLQAQGEIKKRIREERKADREKEFVAKIRQEIPVWTVFDAENAAKK